MEAGIAFREIPQKEESGKMNLSFEDDLAHSDNLSCSTCERDIRPIPDLRVELKTYPLVYLANIKIIIVHGDM